MTRHKGAVPLSHMLDHAREAVAMSEGKTRDDISQNRMLELALIRLVEVIGEAAGRTPESIRDQLPEIPWPYVISMRNRLIHGYDKVDLDILWNTVTSDLPELIPMLEDALRKG